MTVTSLVKGQQGEVRCSLHWEKTGQQITEGRCDRTQSVKRRSVGQKRDERLVIIYNRLKLDSFNTFKFVCEVAAAQSDLCECSDSLDLPFDPCLNGQGNSLHLNS